MDYLEILKKNRKEAHKRLKTVENAAAGIIKAIFDSDPTITYERASETYSAIARLMFEEYFQFDYKITTAEKEGEIK